MHGSIRRFLWSALTCASCLAPCVDAQEDGRFEVTTLWKTFAITEANEVSRITQGHDGRYWAAGSTYSLENGESHWWGELDSAGKRTHVTRDWDPSGFRNSKIVAIEAVPDGTRWIVGERTVSRFSSKGTLDLSRSVIQITPETRYGLSISSAMKTDTGGLVLSGHTQPTRGAMDAWLLEIDADGKKLWETEHDFGRDEWILQTTRKGKHIVSVAISGRYDKFGAGFDRIVILETDERGKQLRTHEIPGTISPNARPALVTRDDHIVLAHSTASFPMRDARILCLDSNLKPTWEKTLAGEQVTAFTPSLSAAGDSLVVTWDGAQDCRVWTLNRTGESKGDSRFPGARGFHVGHPTNGSGRLFLQKIGDLRKRDSND